jgi:flotillin
MSSDVETSHGVKLTVKAICQVKVKTTATDNNGAITIGHDNVKLAAQHFLGQSEHDIAEALQLTMEGHQRQVLGTLTVEEIYKDREAFASKVMEGVMSDLHGMGYQIVSYVVVDVKDSNGYMDALGATQTALVKREAAEGVAKNEAEQRKKVAEYRAVADISEAKQKALADIEVNTRQAEAAISLNLQREKEADSEKTLELLRAQNLSEVNKSREKATAAGLIEKAQQEQIVRRERTQQEVEEQLVRVKVTEQMALQAQEEAKGSSLAELVEKKNRAEASKIEAIAAAEIVKVNAEANAAQVRVAADAEASKIESFAKARAAEVSSVGAAEAGAIEAKGMAEAKVLKEKNLTYQYMGEAGLASIIVEKLPAIAEAIAAPLAKTEKMVFISQDTATGSKVTNDIIKTISTMPDVVESLTGVDMKNVMQKAMAQGKGKVNV